MKNFQDLIDILDYQETFDPTTFPIDDDVDLIDFSIIPVK
jgi:hypothetical protein